jgi:hypothetical protein
MCYLIFTHGFVRPAIFISAGLDEVGVARHWSGQLSSSGWCRGRGVELALTPCAIPPMRGSKRRSARHWFAPPGAHRKSGPVSRPSAVTSVTTGRTTYTPRRSAWSRSACRCTCDMPARVPARHPDPGATRTRVQCGAPSHHEPRDGNTPPLPPRRRQGFGVGRLLDDPSPSRNH